MNVPLISRARMDWGIAIMSVNGGKKKDARVQRIVNYGMVKSIMSTRRGQNGNGETQGFEGRGICTKGIILIFRRY